MFNLDNFIRRAVKKLVPYRVPNVNCVLKLDAMENPYNLPEDILLEVIKEIKELKFNRYPDPMCSDLKKIISSNYQIPEEWVIIGNGSDELILNLLLAFGRNENKILYPYPTFEVYGIIAKMLGLKTEEIPLEKNFKLNSQKFIDYEEDSIIFISYPNNPTGNCFSQEAIYRIIEESNSLVVIDEAYFGFSDKTFLLDVQRYPNLIISRTFSKMFSLASLRVGFLCANPGIINVLLKVKLPYNVNSFSQIVSKVVLSKNSYFKKKTEEIIEERERIYCFLQNVEGITAYPSEANFILFKVENNQADYVYEKLIKKGILIRSFKNISPISDCLRISMGTKEENDIFQEKLSQILSKAH
ncbi:MAG: histidinol-phosphate transaminase [bacterium]|nr:histidinol-phosphate transaminase [bacterium]